MIKIGKCRLKTILKQKGISQAELSRRTSIPTPQLNRYVKGIHIMPLPLAYTIAFALGCAVEELYEIEISGNQVD